MHKRLKIPHTIFRNFLILACAVILAVTTQMVLKEAGATGADDGNVYKKILNGNYDAQDNGERELLVIVDNVKRATEIYHYRINKMFNDKIKKLVKTNDIMKLIEAVTPPEPKSTREGDPPIRTCKAENASTYCLSQKTLDEYFLYRDALVDYKNTKLESVAMQNINTVSREDGSEGSGAPPAQSGQSGAGRAAQTVAGAAGAAVMAPFIVTGGLIVSLGEVAKNIFGIESEKEKIDRELSVARKTLDRSLAVYNEFQIALPLHKKYVELFKQLSKYRDKIAAIRREVDRFPATFLNVTTTACL